MTDRRLDALIPEAQRADVRAPIENARTLPRAAFTSADFFELEVERIFSSEWCALAMADQVEGEGDLLPIDFCGVPLLMVRGDDAVVRVFHNVVPYDACLAVIDPIEGADEIVSPYHGWRYDLRGRLRAVPYWDGTAAGHLEALGDNARDLKSVRCEVECGVVFIDLGGRAGSFEDFIAPLRTALSEYRLDEMEIGRGPDGAPLMDGEDLATNWKTHYENWGINVLHESFVHEGYAVSRDTTGQIPRVDSQGRKTYVDRIDRGFMALQYPWKDFRETYPPMSFEHLGLSSEPELGFFGSLYPNLHFGVMPQMIHLIIALPAGPGRTRTVRAQFYEPNAARSEAEAEERVLVQVGMSEAGVEDARISEAVQRARRSPAFDQAYYSPFWDVMHHAFSQRVLDSLERPESP